MKMSEAFYSKLKPFSHFQDNFATENFVSLPADWVVVITDILGSTAAIQQGRYRQVNAVGVASIVAVMNAVKPLKIPFVFGGDGASLCLPGSRLHEVQEALLGTKQMAKTQFDLILRVGIVPNTFIRQSEYRVQVGKWKVSTGYYQAAFAGEGLAYAEKLVKGDQDGTYSLDSADAAGTADFTGFECRWKTVPSPHEEIISLLVMATNHEIDKANKVYLEVLKEIQRNYGGITIHRPVQKKFLELTTNAGALADEVKIRTAAHSFVKRLIYSWTLPWKVRLGRKWMAKGRQVLGTDWGTYKEKLVENTDFRKFDGMLRMVISGNTVQRYKLVEYLEKQYRDGLLVYGIHISDKALMTCVISDYNQDHVHFVDGSGGGYAMAAIELKQRLRAGHVTEEK